MLCGSAGPELCPGCHTESSLRRSQWLPVQLCWVLSKVLERNLGPDLQWRWSHQGRQVGGVDGTSMTPSLLISSPLGPSSPPPTPLSFFALSFSLQDLVAQSTLKFSTSQLKTTLTFYLPASAFISFILEL